MAFVRTKKIKGKEYRYLVESYRDDRGKVRQRTIKYLGAANQDEKRGTSMVTAQLKNITFEEYLSYDDGTNKRYELVDGKLVEMPPASFLHSDIIDFIADCFKAIARLYNLDIKVKTGDVGVRTGMNSSRIPDISVIDGKVWKSYRRDKSAIIEDGVMLVVEVVSPGAEQIERDYTEKASEYSYTGIPEYWIVDPIEQKITVLILKDGSYTTTVFTDSEAIVSPTFPELKLTATEIWSA
ncbi:MAG: Uma2 family endonuclease [Cyanobacteria bacterium P01_G01_bin.39]